MKEVYVCLSVFCSASITCELCKSIYDFTACQILWYMHTVYKTISGMFKCQVLRYFNDNCVIFLTLLVIQNARQRSKFTGPDNRNIIILNDRLCQLPLFAGTQLFFDMTSFKMAWSMLSSANNLVKREFSSSRSLSLLT